MQDGLTDAIYNYQRIPDYKPYIEDCYWWIMKVEGYNLVVTGREFALQKEIEKLNARIAELEQEKSEIIHSHDALVEEHNKVRDDLIDTQGQLKSCKEFVDKYMQYFPKGEDLQQ